MTLAVHQLAVAKRRVYRRRSFPVVTRRVDKQPWAMALKLAGGDARRLRIVDEHTVVIENW